MTNVKSLLALYVKMGGSLTDTYSDIASGIPVGQYSLISDAVIACSKKYSSGGGLPADFPAEGIANADKFLGFDENGDYAALDAPSGAEKFVVTLTADDSGAETVWTADKTVAEIVAAYEANKIVVAEIPYNDLLVDVPCLSANVIDEDGTQFSYAVFAGNLIGDSDDVPIADINGFESDGSDRWEVSTKNLATTKNIANIIPNGSNEGDLLVWDDDHDKWKAQSNPYAPLIVTMTEDQQTSGTYVGDKTNKEAYEVFVAGRPVVAYFSANDTAFSCQAAAIAGTTYSLGFANSLSSEGAADEYVTITVGN